MKFKGFTAVYVESREEDETAADEDAESAMPLLEEGEVLTLLGLDPKQHFTQPPPRFTEASLIKVAGGAGDRPAVDLRVDPRHDHQRSRLRAPRAPHPVRRPSSASTVTDC